MFSFNKHIQYILGKVKGAFIRLYHVLKSKRGLSINIKLCMYKQLLRPIIAYAFPIWYNISSRQMEKIRVFERKMLKYCLNLSTVRTADGRYHSPSCSTIYNTAKIERIDKFMTKLGLKFINGCTNSNNAIINNGLIREEDFIRFMQNDGYLSSMCLTYLDNHNLLFNENGNIVFYNRRYGTYNIDDLIYTTTQY